MAALQHLVPRQLVPDLSVPLVGGPRWRLCDQKPQHFTMLIFYRGLHCPQCRNYLKEAEARLKEFRAAGVSVIALSCDSEVRGNATEKDWGLNYLPLAWGLTPQQGKAFGLFLSRGSGTTVLGIEEPPLFVEPGLFLVRPDRTLFFASIQNMPFARPVLLDVLRMIEWTVANNYPARGDAEA
ncbi:MAG: peroxiredoxin-like family protein [Hyphomicrobiaceae bacterium]|nr:peroxiredoxin-like family protein [Hyphomicrobiaceae bacterium]